MERSKPLARKTPLKAKTGLKRTPMKRTAARPKRPKKPTRTQLKRKADDMFSRLVRARGVCAAAKFTLPPARLMGFDAKEGIRCSQNLQCAHLVPRRYLSVRWDEGNAVAMCGAHHTYFTHFPIHFDLWVTAWMGPHAWMALKQKAIMASGAPPYEAIIARLQGRLEEEGVAAGPRRA
jgi:hypothetical protein